MVIIIQPRMHFALWRLWFLTALLALVSLYTSAQVQIDTVYTIQIERDIVYGNATDFAGNDRALTLDIAYPTNDTPPACGRPVILILHGGAFMAGSKSDGEVQRLMGDFAKRGYVAVAPNYRKGMFNTERDHSCAFSQLFNVEWNCLNVQDTSEWYRAWFRAVQDSRGALRWVIKNEQTYNTDRFNVFVSGFSAGGFIALGVGYLDHPSEMRTDMGELPDAQKPHVVFESGCIQKYQWDSSINRMSYIRPSLGDLDGELHTDAPSYRIRGIGSFFGAVFYNLFDSSTSEELPALYTFHQPNDLIVPYDSGKKVFQGYASCLYSICQRGILNTPKVYSSTWIRSKALELRNKSKNAPAIFFDSTTNRTDCLGQIANPSLGGHQLDNYPLRTKNMATYFALQYDSSFCTTSTISQTTVPVIRFYPNPFSGSIFIACKTVIRDLKILDLYGRSYDVDFEYSLEENAYTIFTHNLKAGSYFVEIMDTTGRLTQKIMFKH